VGEALRLCRAPPGSGRLALYLAAARVCVLPMTFYSVSLGGAMAWLDGSFSSPLFMLILLGFLAAHVVDNLINDLTDYLRGLDRPGYVRVAYGPHPVASGLLGPHAILVITAAVMAFNTALALYLSVTVSPLILLLAALGALVMLGYSGVGFDLKRLGLGELGVVLVWGPVMAGGTYLALTGEFSLEAALVYMPYAALVGLVLLGKHMDKLEADSRMGVATLPVRLGEARARRLAAALAVSAPLAAAAGSIYFTRAPEALAALLSLPLSLAAARALSRPRPRVEPRGWRVWPLWYAAWAYMPVDAVGRYTLLALLAAGLEGPWKAAVLALAAITAVADARTALSLNSYLRGVV
jgi:1,4-dihydroxy-2-naphthoate octaprenyltransferase